MNIHQLANPSRLRVHWKKCREDIAVRYKVWRTPDAGRRQQHELEFLPAALELIETPPSPVGLAILWSICSFIVIAVLWACLAHIDIVATSQGKIVPSGRVKVIQPVEIGRITAIHVQDGQEVKAGDTLIELDPAETGADQSRYQRDLMEEEMEVARIQAVLKNKPDFEAPDGSSVALVARHQSLLVSTLAQQAATLSSIDQEIAQHEAERSGAEEQIKKLEQTLPLVRRQAEARNNLAKEGYGSRLTALQAQQQAIEQVQDLAIQQQKMIELNATLLSLGQKRQQAMSEFESKQLTALADAEHKADGLRQELAKAKDRNDHQTLAAPVDGIVQQLAVHTIGGVVTPAQELMIVVPSTGSLEIEAQIENKDIGFVRDGQAAEIKVETFPFTRYGLIHGKVLHVSHDAISPEQVKKDPKSSSASKDQEEQQGLTYAARVSMEKTTIDVDGQPVNLTPGMAVTVEIKTGKRRVIEYIASPLMRYKQESLHER